MRKKVKLRHIAINNIIQNGRRSILTVLTVALSVTMIFVIFTYIYSDNKRQIRSSIEEFGKFHVQYINLTNKQIDKLSRVKDIKNKNIIYTSDEIQSKKLYDKEIYLNIINSQKFSDIFKLKQGSFPIKNNEIVLDEWVAESLGLKNKLGHEIDLKFFYPRLESNNVQELKTMKFKLVGLTENITSRKIAKNGYVLVNKDFITKYAPNYIKSANVLFDTNYNSSKLISNTAYDAAIEKNQILENDIYISATEINITKVLTISIIILSIMFVASVVIFNIFYIYMYQKIRFYGILKAIGSTKAQMKLLINIEGLFISILGSILGTIMGILLSILTKPLLGNFNKMNAAMKIEFSPYIILGSFIAGIGLVYIAIYFPIRIISKISEIDAIRYNPTNITNIKHKTNKLKSIITIKYFVFINFLRNKKRTTFTILSIAFTGAVFIIVSSVLDSIVVSNLVPIQGDYTIDCVDSIRRDNSIDPINNKLINQIKSIKGVSNLQTEMYDTLIYNVKDFKKHLTGDEKNKKMRNEVPTDIYGYSDSLINITLGLLNKGSANLNDMKNNNYLIAVKNDTTNYNIGDKVTMGLSSNKDKVEFTIIGIVQNFVTFRGGEKIGGTFLCHQELFKKYGFDKRIKQVSISIDKNKINKASQSLKSLVINKKINLSSYKNEYNEINSIKRTMELIAYSFISILILISIFNLVNTTLTGIIARNREISMAEAVGMSRIQLIKQLLLEGFFNITISLVIIVSIGLPIGYLIVEKFKETANYAIYKIPLSSISVLSIAFILIQILTTLFAENSLHKKSLIERVKYTD